MSTHLSNDDIARIASLVAHQMRAPVGAAGSIIKTLLGEYAGPLTPQQLDLLSRADGRIEEAIATARRVLAVVQPQAVIGDVHGAINAAATVRRAHARFAEEAARRDIVLATDVRLEPAWLLATDDGLTEALNALLSNAVKYTPAGGRIRLAVEAALEPSAFCITVADSGIGVRPENRAAIFEPFYRTPEARASARPGTGLGLALVRSIVVALSGQIGVEDSPLGGALFRMTLPLAPAPGPSEPSPEGRRMRVVIIGGVAAGPKVASKIIRLRPDTDVTVIDRGEILSYAGCGFPYYVSGVVKEQKQLLSTAVGGVRDPVFFQNVKNVTVMNRTEATEIDRAGHRVRIRSTLGGEDSWLAYDKLVLATGARPVVPDLPGVGLRNVFTLHGVFDAEGIRALLARGRARDVVILGGGLLGVEITQALAARGCRVTIVEVRRQILGMLDWEMARLVENHLEANGVRVLTGTRGHALEGNGDGEVQAVNLGAVRLPADLVIVAAGVRPETALAVQAGLALGPTGAIAVDPTQRTSDPDIYAAGDCCEVRNLLTGEPAYVPLGSTANKQGRVAAINICGGTEAFPGVLGTTLCEAFGFCIGRTGLSESQATARGQRVATALIPAPDREHFMPAARPILLKLVVDADSRRLLGAQVVGPGEGAKRIDVAATAIAAGMTVDQVAGLDLGYAPPFSPAMDNLITAANVAKNKLAGAMLSIAADDVHRLQREHHDFLFLDVRTHEEYERVRLPGTTLIPLGALRSRLAELRRDAEIVTLCQVGLKAYEAALILGAAGFGKVRVMDGGIDMWPYERIEGPPR
ncbi:MAG: NADH peroxidase [Lentisphaerae bacterium ADurb.BinA184]|nr:MAG: NADH peroxidase [Lentisphaerae bacterium ADurb.BinA184]